MGSCRVLWQFILVDDLVTSGSIGDIGGFVDTFFEMVWAFFISAICLLIGTIFIMQQKTKGSTILFVYGLVNAIAVFLIVQPLIATDPSNFDDQLGGLLFGFVIKVIVVPILGIASFISIGTNTNEHLGMGMYPNM